VGLVLGFVEDQGPLAPAVRPYVAVTACFLLSASLFFCWALPMFELPKPTGRFAIGTRIFHLPIRTGRRCMQHSPGRSRSSRSAVVCCTVLQRKMIWTSRSCPLISPWEDSDVAIDIREYETAIIWKGHEAGLAHTGRAKALAFFQRTL
jgi:hypothetical protein